MNYETYLARFHAKLIHNHSYEELAELQRLHMQHIPFENLDVIRREPIYLNLNRIYNKIVNQNRGGYCYEVNGLFHWLLGELGFNAQLGAATVRRANGIWAKADTHVIILVHLENETYLTDVGFGDSNYHPININGTKQTDVSGTYKVIQQTDDLYDLTRKVSDEWIPLYRFNIKPKKLVDFHEGCVFNQVSKESSFTHYDLATLATDDGRITISGNTFTKKERGKVIEKIELTDDEKMDKLKNIFGITIS